MALQEGRLTGWEECSLGLLTAWGVTCGPREGVSRRHLDVPAASPRALQASPSLPPPQGPAPFLALSVDRVNPHGGSGARAGPPEGGRDLAAILPTREGRRLGLRDSTPANRPEEGGLVGSNTLRKPVGPTCTLQGGHSCVLL